jgi:hypothetical protein
MINRRPYVLESEIKPGTGVVQGSGDRAVKAPGEAGEGDFIGVYPWEANEARPAGDSVGIVLHGVAKVQAGGTVAAGKFAVLKDDSSGTFIVLPEEEGRYDTVGMFLEGGSSGEYVDLFVQRGSVTITE